VLFRVECDDATAARLAVFLLQHVDVQYALRVRKVFLEFRPCRAEREVRHEGLELGFGLALPVLPCGGRGRAAVCCRGLRRRRLLLACFVLLLRVLRNRLLRGRFVWRAAQLDAELRHDRLPLCGGLDSHRREDVVAIGAARAIARAGFVELFQKVFLLLGRRVVALGAVHHGESTVCTRLGTSRVRKRVPKTKGARVVRTDRCGSGEPPIDLSISI
jgi:hypothetical protein